MARVRSALGAEIAPQQQLLPSCGPPKGGVVPARVAHGGQPVAMVRAG